MKKCLCAMLAFVLCLGCFACGEGGTRGGRSGKTLTYLVSSTTDVHAVKLQGIVDKFNEQVKDEGYKIEIESPGGDYYQSLGNLFASQSEPDIFLMDGGNFNAYARLGYLAPLDGYLEASQALGTEDLWEINSYYRYDRDTGIGSGQMYGLIKDFSPDFMLLYNKTMLDNYNKKVAADEKIVISDSEPLTWTQFYRYASKIQKEMSISYGTSIGFESTRHLMEMIQQSGGKMFESDNATLNIGNAGVRSAFEYFCALQCDHASFAAYPSQNGGKAPASYTTGASVAEQQAFKQQKMFSIFNGLWSFYTYDFDSAGFEVGIAPAPIPDGSTEPYMGCSGMIANCISSRSKNKDVAFRFLEYYMTEGMKELAGIGFNIPGNKTVASSDVFLNPANEKVKARNNYFYDWVQAGKVHPIEYNSRISFNKLETHLNTQLSKYVDDKLSFDDLLTQLQKALKQEITGA